MHFAIVNEQAVFFLRTDRFSSFLGQRPNFFSILTVGGLPGEDGRNVLMALIVIERSSLGGFTGAVDPFDDDQDAFDNRPGYHDCSPLSRITLTFIIS